MSKPAQTPFLAHFAALRDPRQSAKILYPLPEILLLLLCATISGVSRQYADRSDIVGHGRSPQPALVSLRRDRHTQQEHPRQVRRMHVAPAVMLCFADSDTRRPRRAAGPASRPGAMVAHQAIGR
jgi:hypothetical protein